MAKAKRRSSRNASARGARRKSAARRRPQREDAITFLKADHRQVKEWFAAFEGTSSAARKQDLANRICSALRAHTTIEAEIFYPAFLEATGETDIHHEAEVEHDGAKKLIEMIEASGPDDEYFDARVTVLSEMIKHHVNEEEKRGGMFTKARASDMDLDELGASLKARKAQLMGEADEEELSRPAIRRGVGTSRDVRVHMRGGRRDRWE